MEATLSSGDCRTENSGDFRTEEVREEEEQGEEVEVDYVLLDLDKSIHVPPNAPYVLSGLDTLNPVLIIDNKIKLIGEYEETIGTCLIFNESDTPVVHEETGPSEANLFSERCIIDTKQAPTKQVNPVARVHKILKFKRFVEADDKQDTTNKQPDNSQ